MSTQKIILELDLVNTLADLIDLEPRIIDSNGAGSEDLLARYMERKAELEAAAERANPGGLTETIALTPTAPPLPSSAPQAQTYARLPLTEFGNAERMVRTYGKDLMYVEELGLWYQWTGISWIQVTDATIIALCKDVVRGLSAEAFSSNDDKERSEVLSFAVKSQKASMVKSMEFLIRSDGNVRVRACELDKHVHLLGTLNGAIDLRTGALVAPDREARITTTCLASYAPSAKCPLFEETVLGVFGGEREMAAFFKRLMGYTLLGNPKEDALVIPFGSGSNGKSTVLGIIRKVLGGYARTADASTFLDDGPGRGNNAGGPREDVLRLRGARFVYIGEPSENSELKENLVKSMTGGDPMPARGVHGKTTIEVMPTWVPVMPTNHRPIIKGDDYAIWRRIMTVPFLQTFKRTEGGTADLGRAEKLEAELDGILTWLVQGALEYQAKGLCVPHAVETAKEEYKADMDLLGDWLENCTEHHKGSLATVDELWSSWQAYATARGELRFIPSARSLGKRLANRKQFETFNSTFKGFGRHRGYCDLVVKGQVPMLVDFFTEEAKQATMVLSI